MYDKACEQEQIIIKNQDGVYVLTWAWNFTDNVGSIASDDKADTLLGNLAADQTKYQVKGGYASGAWTDLVEGMDKNYNLGVDFAINITVTQLN